MADPSTWSEFPQHFLFCVLEHTYDPPTLRSWSVTCKLFNAASNKALWRQLTVSRKDLLAESQPLSEKMVAHRVLMALRQPAKFSRTISLPCPATLVERLSSRLADRVDCN
ncbi:MAG: hypothetical protein FRX48_08382 [Lasallia pustulata]|uniref:F-box domain-containing protein n=1 Tax=Lasallia pustulata TaxID=136370 RepID=A0A5M8PFD3_9LECA|nr:MAG: hypothetical protein FRX48_08382 [Lasallia pustulata]